MGVGTQPLACAVLALAAGGLAQALAAHPIEEVVVSGRDLDLLGSAVSASQGVVGRAEIALRPLARTGELLETVPGLVATQHSGSGKANQYFLRGFNLDHGTDFATSYASMPVNLRTHGHGQGYTDLNFVIPELVERIEYRKGSYYADVGDFSGAGSAEITPPARVVRGEVEVGAGGQGFRRLLVLDSHATGRGELLWALEGNRYDGPWRDIDEDVYKLNATLRHTWLLDGMTFSLMAMAYDNDWNSADQIPLRAVTARIIGELGSLDPTTGGESSRYSLSAHWDGAHWNAALYVIDYSLDLWSNFTYFLDDPLEGDQFRQVDERRIYGGRATQRFETNVAGLQMQHAFGADWRYDDIARVGLYHSRERRTAGVVRSDAVEEASVGIWWETGIHWNERWRSSLGLRADAYRFEVDPRARTNAAGIDLSANGGRKDDAIVSLKGSLMRTVGEHAELYVAAGQGFHSNDARGVTARVDPVDGAVLKPIDPLIRSYGGETGLRVFSSKQLNASMALWWLQLDSELVFVGDAGNTEASRGSARHGLEATAYYRFAGNWYVDFEYSRSDARFRGRDRADPLLGHRVPGAIDDVASIGIGTSGISGWSGSLRARHFGPRALDENGEHRSHATTVLNLRIAREAGPWRLVFDVLNLLDSSDHDIDYFYESRLVSEAEPVADLHYHVMEPRTLRMYAGISF